MGTDRTVELLTMPDQYSRVSLPKSLTKLITAAAAACHELNNPTPIIYVQRRLEPIVEAVITANDVLAPETDRTRAKRVLRKTPVYLDSLDWLLEAYRSPARKPFAILFGHGFYDDLRQAANLEELKPHEFVRKYLVAAAINDLIAAAQQLQPCEPVRQRKAG